MGARGGGVEPRIHPSGVLIRRMETCPCSQKQKEDTQKAGGYVLLSMRVRIQII